MLKLFHSPGKFEIDASQAYLHKVLLGIAHQYLVEGCIHRLLDAFGAEDLGCLLNDEIVHYQCGFVHTLEYISTWTWQLYAKLLQEPYWLGDRQVAGEVLADVGGWLAVDEVAAG